MSSKRLPIIGYPHLALAEQDDDTLHARTIAELSKAGFTIARDHIVPPDGLDGRQVIAALSAAFREAKVR